jgi:subtilisin family serine protease
MRFHPPPVLALALLTLLVGLPTGTAGAAELQPELARQLESAAPDRLFKVFVLLDAQIDGPSTLAAVSDLGKRERRAHVIRQLKALARDTQAPLVAELDARRAAGEVGEVTRLWLANALIAELDAATIRGLAGDSAVRAIHEVRPYKRGEATDDLPVQRQYLPAVPQAIEPNIVLIGANKLWERGYMGQAKVVGNSDTGTCTTHPDLANHIWTNIDEPINGLDDDGNGFVDDWIGWDFESNDNDPRVSCTEHGTNTAGIVVGDGTLGRQTGVSPRGYIMILKACGESAAMQAAQYAVDNGADAITSSCSYKFPSRPFYEMWRVISLNTMLADVPHANSIGNQGTQLGSHPIPYNISAPGITPPPWLHPDQTIIGGLGAVTATGGVNINLTPYSPSGHGPSGWENIQINYPTQRPIAPQWWDYPWANGTMQGLLKPDVVMPTNVITTNGNGYSGFGGTSAATPHTGGSLALLLSAAPNATTEELSEALQSNTLDLGDPGKDNDFGAGLPNLAQAAASILPDVTPIAEPYGQAVDPGSLLVFRFQWINNTNGPITIWRSVDLHCGGSTQTLAGPGDLTIPAGGTVTANWDYANTAPLSGQLCEVELLVEDGLGGNLVSSTTVDVYVR